jgi:hypothetical protein
MFQTIWRQMIGARVNMNWKGSTRSKLSRINRYYPTNLLRGRNSELPMHWLRLEQASPQYKSEGLPLVPTYSFVNLK